MNLHSDSFHIVAHPTRDETIGFTGTVVADADTFVLTRDTYRCAQLKKRIQRELDDFVPTDPHTVATVEVVCDDRGLPEHPGVSDLSANLLLIRAVGYQAEGASGWWEVLTQDAESLRARTRAGDVRVMASQRPAGQYASRGLPQAEVVWNTFETAKFDTDAGGRVKTRSTRQAKLESWIRQTWSPGPEFGFDAHAFRHDSKPTLSSLTDVTRRDVDLLSVRMFVAAVEPVDEAKLSSWLDRIEEERPRGLSLFVKVNRYGPAVDRHASLWGQPEQWTGTASFFLSDSSDRASSWEWARTFEFGPEYLPRQP